MLRSTNDHDRLYLTADLWPKEPRSPKAATAGLALFAGQFSRFPPVEDVVVALDRIASRTIAA
ncbi:hypothetical protein [Tabrizicola sp. BL-A-41-H6]|uniref:hypothetical protein n=1 Tax=Tabrizicola sp. BL-A-41-H6 TaxID=3421107 RepID=UPI003D664FEE